MEWCFAVWSIDSKAWHRAQNPKELLILCNPEGMLSFGKKLEEIRANHVWKHRNSGEIPEDRFANRPAYINHTHDKSSRARNPSRYRSQAEKSNGHSYSRWCRFLYICRYVFYVLCVRWQRVYHHQQGQGYPYESIPFQPRHPGILSDKF